MAGKGGGAWKVAYADFVTAMMAFFLVMWITAQNQAVKDSIAHYFQDPFGEPDGVASTTTPLEVPEGAATVGPLDMGWGLAGGSAQHKPTSKALVHDAANNKSTRTVIFDLDIDVSTGTMLLFPHDSAVLDDAAQSQLNALIPQLLGKPNLIEIRGHASRRPLPVDAPFEDEWQLCYLRCLGTMKFLTERGVDAGRIRLSQAGVSEPYTLRRESAWQRRNSRVEVYVLREFSHDRERNREASLEEDPQ
jgi:chemotaxis protein MotB